MLYYFNEADDKFCSKFYVNYLMDGIQDTPLYYCVGISNFTTRAHVIILNLKVVADSSKFHWEQANQRTGT
jgi:hypothetical protein